MFTSKAPASDNRNTEQEMPPSTRILVIGAGYAGLLFTMRLAGKVTRQDVQIALVNEYDTFTERPRMHQFATNQVVQWRSLPQMLRRTNVQFLQGRVTSIDPASREIVITHQQQTQHLGYDYLVYALGSETDRQTVPGVAEHATPSRLKAPCRQQHCATYCHPSRQEAARLSLPEEEPPVSRQQLRWRAHTLISRCALFQESLWLSS